MKGIVTILLWIVFVGSAFSQEVLELSVNEQGVALIRNNTLLVKDRVRLSNQTMDKLGILVQGEHITQGNVTVGKAIVPSGAELIMKTVYEDSLSLFSQFEVYVEPGELVHCQAWTSRHDLNFAIYETRESQPFPEEVAKQEYDGTPNQPKNDTEEKLMQLKWWLDAGIITSEEFYARRKEIIGF